MQTILGANGVIGNEVAKALTKYSKQIRLVSRNPRRVNQTNEIFSADLTNAEQTNNAVKDSEIVYLTVGLPYSTKIWEEKWPLIMKNVINACKKHNSKLVFFDNVYLYGRVSGWMNEETPVNPTSKKGEIRANIAEILMDEIKLGNLKALIARSADFYGPNAALSFLNIMVFDNYSKGKKAQWMINDKLKHSLTFTPDAGKATAILGNTESAFNQIWHLPTDKNTLTGSEITKLVAQGFGVKPEITVLKKWMIKMAGFFNPLIKENIEMLYQLESEYLFDSSKFEMEFGFKTTTYETGIIETIKSYK